MTGPELAALAAALREAPPPPRLALRVEEAATALGVSLDFFSEHIAPELRIVRRGRIRLVPTAELRQWLDREAARVLD